MKNALLFLLILFIVINMSIRTIFLNADFWYKFAIISIILQWCVLSFAILRKRIVNTVTISKNGDVKFVYKKYEKH